MLGDVLPRGYFKMGDVLPKGHFMMEVISSSDVSK